MTAEKGYPDQRGEIAKLSEQQTFLPEDFLKDNKSTGSHELRKEWERRKNRRELSLLAACSDARGILPPDYFYWRSIANGDDPTNYQRLIKEANSGIVIAHYAGDRFVAGTSPVGCGGETELQKLLNGAEEHIGAHAYVRTQVKHYDPVMNAILKAGQMAQYTDQPILAAVQDHVTGTTRPVASITHERGVDQFTSRVPMDEILAAAHQGTFNAERVYEGGIPVLPEDMLDKRLQKFMETQANHVDRVNRQYPHLLRTQQVQSPPVIYVSQDTRPGKIKYPAIMGGPNEAFAIRVPRVIEKFEDEEFEYPPTPAMVDKLMQQLSYPIVHALGNWGMPDKSFGLSRTLFLEVRNKASKDMLMEALLTTDFGKQFITHEDSTIIVGYIKNGELYEVMKEK